MHGTRAWSPTGLIPWFSKTEGNTYATLLHHPFLFKGKPTQFSRGSKMEFWRRCRGGLRKSQHTKYSSQTLISRITLFAICLSFSSPPLHPCRFIRPLFSVRLFFACLVVMASPLSTPLSPENEVLNFKQREGENLKHPWYRICNAQNRSTRKQSTSVLLRNFYVGATPWYRYILDTITGGNFLGSHTFDSYML